MCKLFRIMMSLWLSHVDPCKKIKSQRTTGAATAMENTRALGFAPSTSGRRNVLRPAANQPRWETQLHRRSFHLPNTCKQCCLACRKYVPRRNVSLSLTPREPTEAPTVSRVIGENWYIVFNSMSHLGSAWIATSIKSATHGQHFAARSRLTRHPHRRRRQFRTCIEK